MHGQCACLGVCVSVYLFLWQYLIKALILISALKILIVPNNPKKLHLDGTKGTKKVTRSLKSHLQEQEWKVQHSLTFKFIQYLYGKWFVVQLILRSNRLRPQNFTALRKKMSKLSIYSLDKADSLEENYFSRDNFIGVLCFVIGSAFGCSQSLSRGKDFPGELVFL